MFCKKDVLRNFKKFTLKHLSRVSFLIKLQASRTPLVAASSESSIKFLRAWIDENLTWRDHIHPVENKIAKNIRLLYQGKHYVNDKYLRQIYFVYIYPYISYANIAWASTHKTNLKKIPSEPLFLSLNVLNVCQINIFQSVQFMHKIKNKDVPHMILINIFQSAQFM